MPLITLLPPAPNRDDPPDVFVPKANAFVDALALFVTELNSFISTLGSGSTQQITLVADGDVAQYRVMRTSFNAKTGYADSNTALYANSVIGISTNTALDTQDVQIQMFGIIENVLWSWTEYDPIYCGVDGVLTQTRPTTGFQLIVGIPTEPTKMFISIKQPTILF